MRKKIKGFQTGDIVKVIISKKSLTGIFVGKVIIHKTGYFDIVTKYKKITSVNYKFCKIIQRNDGYRYVI